jgi:hypothetical protein
MNNLLPHGYGSRAAIKGFDLNPNVRASGVFGWAVRAERYLIYVYLIGTCQPRLSLRVPMGFYGLSDWRS